MRRRSFMQMLGLTALAQPTEVRAVTPAPAAAPPSLAGFADLGESAVACAAAAQDCLRALAPRLAAREAAVADCVASVTDALAACDALAALAGSKAPFALGFATTVADVCGAAKRDCDKFPQISECVALAAACAQCAEACRRAAG
jgi:Cys-rich four helix bundle protein (predicted Tat secretion target)